MMNEIILKEGKYIVYFFGFLFIISLLFFNIGWQLIILFFFGFSIYYFRNPERIPEDKEAIISPIDGMVKNITYEDGKQQIEIHMGLLDVILFRSPVKGRVKKFKHIHGANLNLNYYLTDELNEHYIMDIENEKVSLQIKHIESFFTRYFKFFHTEEMELGQKYAIVICCSKVIIYLPDNVHIDVEIGDKVKGGESIIGFIKDE